MRTIKLTIAYDGTSYAGWQIQSNGLAIQQVLEEALAKILGAPVRLYSSGRTDAGVHAEGMVAVFKTDRDIPLTAFSDGLNSHLPPDIAVRDAEEASPEFDPRRDAKGKHYRYTILNTPRRSPLCRLYAWHLKGSLDIAAMRKAAMLMVGEKDFASFRTSGCAARTTVRNVFSVDITSKGELILIDVKGSGFLRNMVRIMVGTLVEVGQGKTPMVAIPALFNGKKEATAGMTAPPQGLSLVEVYY
ncbi:MAG: tRNA pseudouridine(38-40) synthase TruA [Geobacteraceae bacterium]|jgi:tRNA pseudouridine38-40 synthase